MQKNFVRNPACALESAIRAAFDTHPERRYPGWSPEALSVCRFMHGGRAHYNVAFPDQDLSVELEPAFLTLTLGIGPTARLLRRFKPGDFLRLQQLVDNSALTVSLDDMRAAVAHYSMLINMLPWQLQQYRIQQRRARA